LGVARSSGARPTVPAIETKGGRRALRIGRPLR
jgi:hypothetical protein